MNRINKRQAAGMLFAIALIIALAPSTPAQKGTAVTRRAQFARGRTPVVLSDPTGQYGTVAASAIVPASQAKQVTCKSLIGDAKQDARLRLPSDFPAPPQGVTYCGLWGTSHRFLNGDALSLNAILRHYQDALRNQGYRIENVQTNARGLTAFSFNRGDARGEDMRSRDIGKLDTGGIYNLVGSSADPPKAYEIRYLYGSRSPRRPR